jgi:hypothetical protein
MDRTILFNPVSLVHDRNVDLFRKALPEWSIRCIYNLKQPWFAGKKQEKDVYYFTGGIFPRAPRAVFDSVKCLVLFTAQARVPPCNLIEEAAMRSIPVIAIEEVYMMMLEQGLINNYVLPVDHLFTASEYERSGFLKSGVPQGVAEVTGCPFGSRGANACREDEKEKIKKEIGLLPGKRTATLCLSFLFPGGETLDVRRELLSCVSQGLPEGYELLVKPHPSELDKEFTDFIARYAPTAKIAGPTVPIDRILDITDVLFNRGNSQVVIDALRRNVSVIAVPAGRKTVFHELSLDEAVVDRSDDIAGVLDAVQKKGMDIYRPLLQKHLSVSAEDALARVAGRIDQIAEKKEVFKPLERLAVLSLFWAWMGHNAKALKTLAHVSKHAETSRQILGDIEKLIGYEAEVAGLERLMSWAGIGTYNSLVIQSLWIKSLYMKRRRLNALEAGALSGYPPTMNMAAFAPYIHMLHWVYENSGARKEADALSGKCNAYLGPLKKPAVPARLKYSARLLVNDLAWKMS